MFIKDISHSNISGFWKLHLFPIKHIAELGDVVNGRVNEIKLLPFDSNFAPSIITGKTAFEEKQISSDYFEYQFSFAVARDELATRNEFADFDQTKYIALIYDNNGEVRLLGDLTNEVRFETTLKKDKASDLNAYIISGEWQSRHRAAFANDISISYVDIYADFVQSNCIVCTTKTALRFWDDDLTVSSIVSKRGTASITVRDGKIIVTNPGNLYI